MRLKIKLVFAPNEMKLRTKLLVSNREQTKIQVSLSPPSPSPHPTHQQQMRNTAEAQRAVFCSRAGPDPSQAPQPATSVQREAAPGMLDALGCTRILHGWGERGGFFRIFLGLFCFALHQPSSQRLSPGQGLPSRVAPTQWWAVNCPSLLGALSHSRHLRSPLLPH